MMESSEPPWGVVVLALVAACALAHGDKPVGPAYLPVWGCPVAQPRPTTGSAADPGPVPATADGVRATAKLCIYCTGVAPADGRVYATIYLTIDPTVDVRDLRFAALELVDAQGTTVAYGLPPGYIGVGTAAHGDVGPFTGRIARGANIVLWMGSELDVIDHGLQPLPVQYQLHMIANGNRLDIAGALEPPGPTA